MFRAFSPIFLGQKKSPCSLGEDGDGDNWTPEIEILSGKISARRKGRKTPGEMICQKRGFSFFSPLSRHVTPPPPYYNFREYAHTTQRRAKKKKWRQQSLICYWAHDPNEIRAGERREGLIIIIHVTEKCCFCCGSNKVPVNPGAGRG